MKTGNGFFHQHGLYDKVSVKDDHGQNHFVIQ